ncbi:ribonuclease P protein component [Methylophilus sp. Leaf408]|uniref:ribonuclease P protein component n=1 Tax=Methylophilus sp. Leaf408 TaxID=2876561 RepID=UPI001E5A013D|nr:ribonuclease P protein component [Methylophilus sp. Leaf408]
MHDITKAMTLYKLRKTDEFSSVFTFRKRLYGEWLLANIKPNQQAQHRYGLVVSKKIAKLAVSRNYMKRVLRELLRNQPSPATSGYDVVLQVRKKFQHADFPAVQRDLSLLLVKLKKTAVVS